MDIAVSPKKDYEDTGVDGSRSTHVEWDGQATCVDLYLGYKLFGRAIFLAGYGVCFIKEYEVMEGYSILSSYERNSLTNYSPMFGLIYEFPASNGNNWYLKYDFSIGNYDRHCFNIGYKF